MIFFQISHKAERLRVSAQIFLPQVRQGQLSPGGAHHVPRAHAGGMPGGRGDDHAAHVGKREEPRADAGISAAGGTGVRARVA